VGGGDSPRLAIACVAVIVFACGGCRREPLNFDVGGLHAAVLSHETGEPTADAAVDVRDVLENYFGTPDEPRMPAVGGSQNSAEEGEEGAEKNVDGVIDPERLTRAAGPVFSDRDDQHYGLYREHCVACHGIKGDGRGAAAALQSPYPRDFTAGIFKYKSTPRGKKPTRQDLLRTLRHGLPGTSMPSFALLRDDELQALTDYVIYLSVRGEVERKMLTVAANEMDYGAAVGSGQRWIRPDQITAVPRPSRPPALSGRDMVAAIAGSDATADSDRGDGDAADAIAESSPEQVRAAEQDQLILAYAEEVLNEWGSAAEQVLQVDPAPVPASDVEAIAAGKELFHGPVANCASCHGPAGAGLDRVLPDYDDWTRRWTTNLGIDPQDTDKLEPFLDAGGLKPRPLPPRRLDTGSFRGGGSPSDLYRRIVHGIDGTPMPAVNLVAEPNAAGLTEEQVWQIVHYVISLAPESHQIPSIDADGETTAAQMGTNVIVGVLP
jgi:mono/diheme cytochrome c family protein